MDVYKAECLRSDVVERQTLPNIVHKGGIILSKSTVNGTVDVRGSITMGDSVAESLRARGSVYAHDSKVTKEVNARGSLTAERCEVGNIDVRGLVCLKECPKIQSIRTRGHLMLMHSTVEGDVITSGGRPYIEWSKIKGTLTCSLGQHDSLVIDDSDIETIDLRSSDRAVVEVLHGDHVIRVEGNVAIGVVEGDVTVSGPGVAIGVVRGDYNVDKVKDVGTTTLQSVKPAVPRKQTLHLRNSTVRNVIFGGGDGEVILYNSSWVIGTITGGKMTRAN